MIYTALSHRNSPRQRDRAVSNLQWGRDDRPVMPDVRTPTGLTRSPLDDLPRQKQEAPSAEQSTLRASRQRRQGPTTGGRGHCLNHIRTPVAQCRYLYSDLSLTERAVGPLFYGH